MKALLGIISAALLLSVATGCYYYEQDYARSPYAGNQRNPQPAPEDWQQPPAPAPQPGSPESGMFYDETPLPPDSDTTAAIQAEGVLEEAGLVTNYNFTVKLFGVQVASKPDIEKALRAEPGVKALQAVYYNNAELGLGVKFEGSVESLKNAIFNTCRGRAKRFVIEAAQQAEAPKSLKVRIFAPADGSRLASTTVFVGVEAEGGNNLSVSVNGVPAEPLAAAGRYRAKIECNRGVNEIVATVRDESGAVGAGRITVTVAGEELPAEPGMTVLVFGVVSDPLSTVTVDGRPVKVEPDGTYRTEAPLPEGKSFVTVVITDSVGNKTVKKVGK